MSRNKNSFLYNTITLFLATIIAKIFGAAYKIPLASLLGGEGMGYYMTAYSLFGPISSIILTALSMTITKLIASKSYEKQEKKLLKNAFTLYISFGFILSIFLFFNAKNLSILLGNEKSAPCIAIIAPAVFFCSAISVIRGYFEGKKNMFPSAFSVVIESFFRLIFGSLFAFYGTKWAINNYEKASYLLEKYFMITADKFSTTLVFAATFAILGVTISIIIGFFYCLFTFKKVKLNSSLHNSKNFYKIIIFTAFPLCIFSIMNNLASMIDLVTIVNRLNESIKNYPYFFIKNYDFVLTEIKIDELPNYLFGVYGGIAMTIFNIVPAFLGAISTSTLPNISEAFKNSNKNLLKMKIEEILKYTLIIILPCGFSMGFFSETALKIIFPNKTTEIILVSEMLKYLGFTSIIIGFTIPLTTILQGMNFSIELVYIQVFVTILKYILNIILISIPKFNIYGAIISTTICYGFMLLFEFYLLNRYTKFKIKNLKIPFKILISFLIYIITQLFSFNFFNDKIPDILVLTISSVISLLIYSIFLLILKVIIIKTFKNPIKS